MYSTSQEKQGLLSNPWGVPGSFTSVCLVARGFVVRAEPSAFPPSQRKGSACEADGSSDRGDNHHPGQGASGRQTSLRQPWSGVRGRELREDCPSRALTAWIRRIPPLCFTRIVAHHGTYHPGSRYQGDHRTICNLQSTPLRASVSHSSYSSQLAQQLPWLEPPAV